MKFANLQSLDNEMFQPCASIWEYGYYYEYFTRGQCVVEQDLSKQRLTVHTICISHSPSFVKCVIK